MAYNHQTPYDVTFGPTENCTLALCDPKTSVYEYVPSLAANATFVALFGIAIIFHVLQGIRYRMWAFMVAMFLGCAVEMAGYGGRLMMHHNPFSFPGFITQIVCITIAPAFFSAAIYITLSQIVQYLGVEWSRFRPSLYYYFFIACDIVSLTLQGTGGGMSSTSSGNSKTGVDIAIAGLAFQVFTLSVFITLACDYAVRYLRNRTEKSLEGRFKRFVFFLALAILLILVRCVYRIDELSNGYKGPLIHDQGLFIGLEGVMVIMAVFVLNLGHPGLVFASSTKSDTQEVGKIA